MTKICPVCQKELKDNDIAVALLMVRFHPKENKYDLDLLNQLVLSHVFCAQVKTEIKEG